MDRTETTVVPAVPASPLLRRSADAFPVLIRLTPDDARALAQLSAEVLGSTDLDIAACVAMLSVACQLRPQLARR